MQESPVVAKELLGSYLHRVINGVELIGKIVETEAYGPADPASHSYRGVTERTRTMFMEGGLSYVYFTYGMYYCFNISTNEEGIGEAVLIRGIEPLQGMDVMKKLRPAAKRERDLTNGPGKICQAFHLTKKDNGIDLITSDELFVTEGEVVEKNLIGVSSRIGIRMGIDHPWRFYVKGNPYVSPGKPSGVL